MAKKIYGVGVNDANYKTAGCPFYDRWHSMLRRCYSKKSVPSVRFYENCSVCTDWLVFSNFKSWMQSQDWQGKDLDKDILFYENKVYSPETCRFVSHEVNSVLTDHGRARGDLPQGVTLHKQTGKFVARCMAGNGKRKYLGLFESEEKASKAYIEYKTSRIRLIAKSQPHDVRAGLLRHADILERGITL